MILLAGDLDLLEGELLELELGDARLLLLKDPEYSELRSGLCGLCRKSELVSRNWSLPDCSPKDSKSEPWINFKFSVGLLRIKSLLLRLKLYRFGFRISVLASFFISSLIFSFFILASSFA